MLLLENPIQHYAWGSRTQLAQLLGKPPSLEPEAELWIGAHPKAPSRMSDGRSLRDAIHNDPEGMLGARVNQRFRAELPFLLKVLAVDAPLSLQAHPNLEQARAGFAREERAGVPLDAPERTYKDENHKPELLCALTPFEALSGFRSPGEAARLFEALALEESEVAKHLKRGEAGLRSAFVSLFSLAPREQAALTSKVVAGCQRLAKHPGPFADSVALAIDLARRYPADIGVVASLLLNHITLQPFEAIYLAAGSLHAYLSGVGVEIMANSDNVLRGGLTPKHVDVPELLNILRFESATVTPTPVCVTDSGEVIYSTPAPDFRLSRFDLTPEYRAIESSNGPELLLCVEGQAQVELAAREYLPARPLRRGQACFLTATSGDFRLKGSGRVFRATVGSI